MSPEMQHITEIVKSWIVAHQNELILFGIGYVVGVVLKENALLIVLLFIVLVAWGLS